MTFHPNLDPELRAAIERTPLPTGTFLSYELLAEQRAQIAAMVAAMPRPDTHVVIEDRLVPGPEGAPDVRLRTYRPPDDGPARPGLYWIHGGGMIIGVPEIDDAMMIDWVERLGVFSVSVD
jgi:acetyl esterase/lipase